MRSYLLIILTLFCGIAFSQTATPPSVGDGTSGNPYQIGTLNNLVWLQENSFEWNKSFIQMADINASSTSSWNSGEGWRSIGYEWEPFTGVYDGDDHYISGLTINYPEYSGEHVGFFGYVGSGAEIKNLSMVGGSITANYKTGGLAGTIYEATITNCHSSVSVNSVSLVGGLIGFSQISTITSCSATADVNGGSETGGLIGYSWIDVLISNCFATGNVYGASGVGGFCGRADESKINNNYSTGNILPYMPGMSNNNFGGFIGTVIMTEIENNYCTGNISTNTTGDYVSSNNIGGFVGYNSQGAITNCYSTGVPMGNSYVGGFTGRAITGGNYATINCFWDTQTSDVSTSAGGIGKTTAEMRTQSTFTGWDFSTPVWDIVSSAVYPFLAWQNSETLTININPMEGGTIIGEGSFPPDTPVTITAIQNSGYSFVNWTNSGAGTIANSNASTTTFIMPDQSASITANFQAQLYTLTMSSNNASYGNATDNTNSGPYAPSTVVSITAAAEPGYAFTGWSTSGGGTFGNINDKTTTFTMPGEDVTLTANFEIGYDLTIQPDDPGHGSALDMTGNSPYTEGYVVTITASPSTGYEFQNWTSSGGGIIDDDEATLTTFTMPAENVTVTANFIAVYDLTINVNNASMGSASDITDNNPYPEGFPISIQAVPQPGYIFTKWTCTGGSFLEITSPSTFFAMSGSNATITANFANEFSTGGSGTDIDPWLISNAYELNNLRNYTGTSNSDKFYKQTADIDLAEYSNWEPIGKVGTAFDQSFYGNYDGNGLKINNLVIDRTGTGDIGLFGVIKDGSLTGLEINNGDIQSDGNRSGLLLGYCYLGSITNCVSSGSLTGTGGESGGIVGKNLEGNIENCNSSATVSGDFSVGGIVGVNDTGTILSCYSTGNISGTGVNTGGLVGDNTSGSSVSKCYATGDMTGRGLVGGLVGDNSFQSTITDCFSTGNVESTGGVSLGINVGGLVGQNFDSNVINCYSLGDVLATGDNAGGLVGNNYQQDHTSTIDICYSIGNVSGVGISGGLVGANNSNVTNSFWDTETSGLSSSSGGIGKTTAEMNSHQTYNDAGWDYKYETMNGTEDVWYIDTINNNKYPWLVWQNLPLQPPTSYVINSSSNEATLTWDGALGATYTVYSSLDPTALFPDDWDIEEEGLTDPNWVDNNISNTKGKFYKTISIYPYK